MKNKTITVVLLFIAFSSTAQKIGYNIYGTLTNPYSGLYSLITLDSLENAITLKDINAKYHPNWVASYIAVDITTTCDGLIQKADSSNDTITTAQLHILKNATANCDVTVKVDYIPENTLKYNPPRQLSFSLRSIPIYEAKYNGGYQKLEQYIKKSILDKTPKNIDLAKIKFSVNETGEVINVQTIRSSGSLDIDKLLVHAICNMPKWEPARNVTEVPITQDFEFSIGTALLLCDYPR